MTIPSGTDVSITIPNARIAEYDPATDRYFVHSPAFYGGAWVKAADVTERPLWLWGGAGTSFRGNSPSMKDDALWGQA